MYSTVKAGDDGSERFGHYDCFLQCDYDDFRTGIYADPYLGLLCHGTVFDYSES